MCENCGVYMYWHPDSDHQRHRDVGHTQVDSLACSARPSLFTTDSACPSSIWATIYNWPSTASTCPLWHIATSLPFDHIMEQLVPRSRDITRTLPQQNVNPVVGLGRKEVRMPIHGLHLDWLTPSWPFHMSCQNSGPQYNLILTLIIVKMLDPRFQTLILIS